MQHSEGGCPVTTRPKWSIVHHLRTRIFTEAVTVMVFLKTLMNDSGSLLEPWTEHLSVCGVVLVLCIGIMLFHNLWCWQEREPPPSDHAFLDRPSEGEATQGMTSTDRKATKPHLLAYLKCLFHFYKWQFTSQRSLTIYLGDCASKRIRH